jgi:hypothetical protein
MPAASIKKDTEFDICGGFCECCNISRFFYRFKDKRNGDDWFCQLCGFIMKEK